MNYFIIISILVTLVQSRPQESTPKPSVEFITFSPGFSLRGWPPTQLTPPLYSLGTAGVPAYNIPPAPGRLLQITANPYTFTTNSYYYVQYPIYNPDEIVAKSSQKDFTVEKLTSKLQNPVTSLPKQNIKLNNPKVSSIIMQALISKDKSETIKSSNSDPSIAFSASYKANPQFNYLKNQHTIDFSKVIKLRTKENLLEENKSPENTTTLILKPQAMAVAGLDGTAIATPLARALVEKGTNVDIYFEPQAVAVAGPGGIAHAQSELEIAYLDENHEDKNIVTYVPFYGGAKGQTLQITELSDGTVITQIIKNNEVPTEATEVIDSELLPEIEPEHESDFSKEIRAIHQTAQTIIKLQTVAKTRGQLSEEEQEKYNQEMEQLNLATRNLAQFQQMQQDEEMDDEEEIARDNLKFWFEQKKNKLIGKQSEENKEEEQTNGEEGNEENGDSDDGVAINLPPEDASVAEAKPVGLAVAGIGGVAASKPIATAVVGPAGLAIARPVATAIAGVNPEDAMIPIYADGTFKLPERKKEKPKESNKDNCEKGDKCDKDKKKEEKPKQDYEIRNYEY